MVPFAIHGGPDILPKGTWRTRGGLYRITMGAPLESHAHPDAEALRLAAEAAVRVLLEKDQGKSTEGGVEVP